MFILESAGWRKRMNVLADVDRWLALDVCDICAIRSANLRTLLTAVSCHSFIFLTHERRSEDTKSTAQTYSTHILKLMCLADGGYPVFRVNLRCGLWTNLFAVWRSTESINKSEHNMYHSSAARTSAQELITCRK